MTILAFSGRKQSGKSTAAQYVEYLINSQSLPITYKTYSFADPLKKDICMDILGLTYDQCYGSDEDKNTMTDLAWNGESLTARRAMEVIGTDIFRQLLNDVWVRATMLRINREKPDIAIIPDCRFPNEVDTILQYGGHVIRFSLDPYNATSNSESALDPEKYDWKKFSCIINNHNMSIDEKNQNVLDYLTNKGILQL